MADHRQENALMRALGGLIVVLSAAAMVFLTPVLAEASRHHVAELLYPRYAHATAGYLMTGYEILIWPAVFIAVRGLLMLALFSLALAIIRRGS